jgi:hypothetical protein
MTKEEEISDAGTMRHDERAEDGAFKPPAR